MEELRLAKYLSHAGIGARRKVEEYISQGRVRVNGEVVTTQGVKINPEKDQIEYRGELIKPKEHFTHIILNKPTGYLCTNQDERGRKSIIELIDKKYLNEKLSIVGRLDKETEGLVLLTSDGELANVLMHPRYEKEKEYEVHVRGELKESERATLLSGITIDIDGKKVTTQPCSISNLEYYEKKNKSIFQIVLKEGKKRQIRLMCDAIGHPVTYLKRIRIGEIFLGNLPLGKIRELSQRELDYIQRLQDKS